MSTHIDLGARPASRGLEREERTGQELPVWRLLVVGGASGLVGGIAMAAPIVIWDWTKTEHRALELPMAATAWLFGLTHFSHDRNLWWPIVVGAVLFAAYWALSGIVFAALADRFWRVEHPLSALAAGAAWSFATFVFFWYVLLPIARDGAPFRAPAGDALLFTAPDWVWILGFGLLGVVTAATYTALRRPVGHVVEQRGEGRAGLPHAA